MATDGLYFQTLAEDTVRNVVRHVSDCPRHPSWHRFTNANNIFTLLEVGGVFETCVKCMFDAITTIPNIVFRTGVIPEDDRSWLFLRDNEQAERLPLFIEKLNIRVVELSRRFPFPMSVNFLTKLSKTVTHLYFEDYLDSDNAANERRIMKRLFTHLGPVLTLFESTATNANVIWAVSKYCTKLTSLKLHKIGTKTEPLSLASFSNWNRLGTTVTSLAIQYAYAGNFDDARLVRGTFRNVRQLSVEFHPAIYLQNTRLLLEYYMGLERNQLEFSDLAAILGTSITVLHRVHPNARFDACIISPRDSCGQFIGLGDSLKNVTFNAQGASRESIEAAVANCTRMESLFVLFAIRAPMRYLHTLHLVCEKKEDVEIYDYVAKNTGRLECLTIRGYSSGTDVWKQIADANKALRRVRIHLKWTEENVKLMVAILNAFGKCRDLHEIWADVGDPHVIYIPAVRRALVQFRARNIHVRIADVTYLA